MYTLSQISNNMVKSCVVIYDAVMIFNIFQKVCLPSYVDLFTFTAPSGSTADASVE
jgi:hypothetical protein